MKIHEAMKRTGLSRKAIYVYEDRRLLSPSKGAQGYRDYSEEDVQRLLLIAKMRELDLSLETITQILGRPGDTDLLIQRHYDRMQEELQGTLQKLSRLQTILYNLPPSADLEDFTRAADIAVPQETARALASRLSEDIPRASARRLVMQMYEAFLDVPLDSPQRWAAWYDLLEKMEQAGEQLWEGYETYYGDMTPQQRDEDYRLRRELVVGYTRFTPRQEEEKACEILARLEELTQGGAYARRWQSYYDAVVAPSSDPGDPSLDIDYSFRILSGVYHRYHDRFRKIMEERVYPFLRSSRGQPLLEKLEETLGRPADLRLHTIIYFDFYNNTLEKALPEP